MSKRYSKEFKRTIIELFTQGKSARQLSLEYDVGYSTLLKWVQGSKPISPNGLTQDEVKALRKQLKEKDEEITLLKKHSVCWQESEADRHSVKKMCAFLGVSRATYYRKINFKPSKRALERDLLDERVLRIYNESDRIYGAGKIHYLLTQEYQDYRKTSMKRVQKSMKRQSIQSIAIKKFKAGKSSKKILENYKNLLNQDFSTTGLNQKWVADITYIHTLENDWCYLSTVMDLHSRKIIGYQFNKKWKQKLSLKL